VQITFLLIGAPAWNSVRPKVTAAMGKAVVSNAKTRTVIKVWGNAQDKFTYHWLTECARKWLLTFWRLETLTTQNDNCDKISMIKCYWKLIDWLISKRTGLIPVGLRKEKAPPAGRIDAVGCSGNSRENQFAVFTNRSNSGTNYRWRQQGMTGSFRWEKRPRNFLCAQLLFCTQLVLSRFIWGCHELCYF